MSSLPSWVASARSLSTSPRRAAITAAPIATNTGNSTRMIAMMMPPATRSPYARVRPGLDLDERAERELLHRDRAPSRPMIAERAHVDLVHRCEVAHVREEHRALHDLIE